MLSGIRKPGYWSRVLCHCEHAKDNYFFNIRLMVNEEQNNHVISRYIFTRYIPIQLQNHYYQLNGDSLSQCLCYIAIL